MNYDSAQVEKLFEMSVQYITPHISKQYVALFEFDQL